MMFAGVGRHLWSGGDPKGLPDATPVWVDGPVEGGSMSLRIAVSSMPFRVSEECVSVVKRIQGQSQTGIARRSGGQGVTGAMP